jgi:hypothetical protein
MRHLYPKVSLKVAVQDHDYLKMPFTEYWVDSAAHVSEHSAALIEANTREKTQSKQWFEERIWRITASRSGEVSKMTKRRNMDKICQSFMTPRCFNTKATNHGKLYESKAIRKF